MRKNTWPAAACSGDAAPAGDGGGEDVLRVRLGEGVRRVVAARQTEARLDGGGDAKVVVRWSARWRRGVSGEKWRWKRCREGAQ